MDGTVHNVQCDSYLDKPDPTPTDLLLTVNWVAYHLPAEIKTSAKTARSFIVYACRFAGLGST